MAITTRYGEPQQIQAGDTVSFKKTSGPYTLPDGAVADFPTSDGFTLKYRIVGGSLATPATATATAADGEYTVAFAASAVVAQEVQTTARLHGWFENAGDTARYTIYDAPLTLLPNAETATATELETHDAVMLRLIRARLQGRLAAGADLDSYGVAGRSVSKIPFAELAKWEGIYVARVWKEQNRGQSFSRHLGAFARAR